MHIDDRTPLFYTGVTGPSNSLAFSVTYADKIGGASGALIAAMWRAKATRVAIRAISLACLSLSIGII
jgi:hypothetical protein